MDDIALNSDLTQVDRAERARAAWQVYADAYGGSEIGDLITDLLHLADVDDADDGAAGELLRALTSYEGERPDWPESVLP